MKGDASHKTQRVGNILVGSPTDHVTLEVHTVGLFTFPVAKSTLAYSVGTQDPAFLTDISGKGGRERPFSIPSNLE